MEELKGPLLPSWVLPPGLRQILQLVLQLGAGTGKPGFSMIKHPPPPRREPEDRGAGGGDKRGQKNGCFQLAAHANKGLEQTTVRTKLPQKSYKYHFPLVQGCKVF